jgi:hypothetical protein
MKKTLGLSSNPSLTHVAAMAILLLGASAKFYSHSGIVYDDPFHHGELVATLPSILIGEMGVFTIHGALDWIPAWFAQQIYGGNNHFLPTMAIHATLNVIACSLLYSIVVSITNVHKKYDSIELLVAAVVIIYMVGIRDVFILLSIFLFIIQQRTLKLNFYTVLMEGFLGIVLAVNLLWSFDRGIAGIASIGGACIILFVSERRHLITLTSFVLCIVGLTLTGAFSFSDYLENIKFLVNTSSQWSYGLKILPVSLILAAAACNTIAIYYLAKSFILAYGNDWAEVANLYFIFILCLIMFKIGINRADFGHIPMALWAPMLAYLHLPIRENAIERKCSELFNGIHSKRWTILIFSSIFFSINAVSFTTKLINEKYHWLTQISDPPRNEFLVGENIQWVSSEIHKTGSRCIFDLSNNGTINGITELQACTKYIYPVYATQRYEEEMIQQLKLSNPPVVVFSSNQWAFNIDGRSMHDRFPDLKKYLLKTYPYEKCNFGYCLRYADQPDEKNFIS